MELFLDFLKEVLKGIIRVTSGHYFQMKFLEERKTTPRRHKQKGGFQNKK
ncbi:MULTISPECIES: hypothetical protein [Sporosarcina]|uniref:Uncharacterized protein n=1 Tax=Sporosarcina contaminans TaxID=633403 RepID=A0ABW3TZU4_9BACL